MIIGHIVEGHCCGYNWYGNYGICKFPKRKLSPEELRNFPVEDHSQFGLRDVEGLIPLVQDIIKVDGRFFVSLDILIESKEK